MVQPGWPTIAWLASESAELACAWSCLPVCWRAPRHAGAPWCQIHLWGPSPLSSTGHWGALGLPPSHRWFSELPVGHWGRKNRDSDQLEKRHCKPVSRVHAVPGPRALELLACLWNMLTPGPHPQGCWLNRFEVQSGSPHFTSAPVILMPTGCLRTQLWAHTVGENLSEGCLFVFWLIGQFH